MYGMQAGLARTGCFSASLALPSHVKKMFIFYLMFLKLDLIVRPFFLPILIP